jgi:DNA-binding CsgD family transcriptional regulator
MPVAILDSQAVELLYQAALEPGLWPQALGAMLPGFRSQHVSFLSGTADDAPPLLQHNGFSDAELKVHFSPEAQRCWANWRPRFPPGQMVTNRHVMSDREWERSETYNEYIRHSGVYHGALLYRIGGKRWFHFAICRPKSADTYSDDELAILQTLIPHLASTVELQSRLKITEQDKQLLRTALDRIESGALIVDAACMPLIANRRAQALLDRNDGLVVSAGGLRATDAVSGQKLADALAATAAANATERRKLHLPRRRSRFPLLLEIMPVARLGADLHGAGEAAALVFITEPDAPRRIDYDALGDNLRLTRREIEVVDYLVQGVSPEKITAKLDISLATVRFHMKNAFQKTGTRSQIELAALVRRFETD